VDDRAIARWRLHTLALAGHRYASPTAVVEGLLAVQAENHRQASWAVASRATPLVTESEFGRLFDDGSILRTHVLRPTWHYTTPADIRWLLELTAPRIRRTFAQAQRQLDIDDATLERSAEVIVEALAGGHHLTRSELAERLGDAGLPSAGPGLALVVSNAELAALVCSGALQGSDHTYALLAERAPAARSLDRDAAVAELVRRYFTGHGPATERDLAYWASMTLTDVRAGLAAVGDQLERFEHSGRTFWWAHPPPGDGPLSPRAHLLLVLDEYHNGYQDSRYVLDADGSVPRGRGANVGMALVDGQMIGDLRRRLDRRSVRFEIGCFRELDPSELEALHEAADRCRRFLEVDAADVTVRPAGARW
jgi:hypothetical protein